VWGMISISDRFDVGDLEVVNLTTETPDRAIEHLRVAIDLIRITSPNRLVRIHRDVRRVLLIWAGGPIYWPYANGFAIDLVAAQDLPADRLALTIVHEATHARLWRAGFRYTPDIRERIEHICVRAELDLAERLPDAAELTNGLRKKLAQPWWTESALAERLRAAREVLRQVGRR
jgi:hypothetical protein